ncbi:hypothetical protein ABNQ39_11280 [Azospirillum sp. A26]|uniref:hypothetical protein n=1 Tax=Azospirillum sp. A26 TaxID=3160607 RepID=UPI00366C8F0C
MKPASKPAAPAADDGPATLPVVLTLTVPAHRRADLPDVFTAEVEQRGRVLARRHFRQADGGGMEDVTELVTEVLLSRKRAATSASQMAQAEAALASASKTPRHHREAHGGLVDEETMAGGRTRSRALTALGTIRQRDLLTTRQWEAGDRLAQDAKIIAGAREAKDDVACDGGGTRDWEDFAIAASRRLNLAREVCQSMAWYEGVSPWVLVERVVLQDQALTDAVGSKAQSVVRRGKVALRIGLDAVGDAYGLPAAVTRTNVLRDGIPVPMTVTEDLDGKDRQEELRRVWRSITLDGKPWVATGETMPDLYEVAKKRLKERS